MHDMLPINGAGPYTSPRMQVHPFSQLQADEIRAVTRLIEKQWPEGTRFQFKVLTLEEPDKDEALAYLEAEHANKSLPVVERRAWVNYYIRNTNKFHEAIVNINTRVVEKNVRLGANVHGSGDGAEITAMETIALEDEGVKKEIEKLKLPNGSVLTCDPWIYGSDGVNDDERMYQCFLYMRHPDHLDEADGNHYALPLPISPVISTVTMKVIRIDILPTGADETVKPIQPYKPRPCNEYLPEFQKLRKDLKPLNVVQPKGASFTVTEGIGMDTVDWQKWKIQVAFNQREGMVLYNIRYDNRTLFYRVSLSDMNIPYADPRAPFHKKSAFDLGDAGAGIMANNLKLGCDCLGSIYYLSGLLADDNGMPIDMPNVICIHEQDAGIGWKHTNYRTQKAAVTRSRELVIQSIITVANYEYILAFIFNQAAEMTYEVRATGILSTQPVDDDVQVPFGTVVHPGALAVHHQHIFSLRVDPHLDDSRSNRLVYSEARPMTDDEYNPHGNGYVVHDTVVKKSGGYNLAPQNNRVFKIQNVANLNPISGSPVGYKITAPPFQTLLSKPNSFNFRRAEFASHHMYAIKYAPDELYAGGRYTNQSRGGDGVGAWSRREDDIVDKDLVLFVQFGLNHIPRVEDFPVMPCETIRVGFKPVNFFDRNPAIDVPPSEQAFNRSVGLNGQAAMHHQPTKQVKITGNGKVGCCDTS